MDKEEAIDKSEQSKSNWRYRNSKQNKDKKDMDEEVENHD